MTISKLRRWLYRSGSGLGYVQAARRPRRIPRRAVNVALGRKVVRRIWR